MNIVWEDYLLPPLKKPNDSDVIALESLLGVKLPYDYVDFLKEHQKTTKYFFIIYLIYNLQRY